MKKVIKSSSDDGFVLRAKTWDDMINQLEEKGYFVDSAYRRSPEEEIQAYKGGKDAKTGEPVIIRVNQYLRGDYEVMEKYIKHDSYWDDIEECNKITAAYADDDLLDDEDESDYDSVHNPYDVPYGIDDVKKMFTEDTDF